MIQQTSMSSADGRNACEYHYDCGAENVRREGAEDGGKHMIIGLLVYFFRFCVFVSIEHRTPSL